jgi:hypothetical protein
MMDASLRNLAPREHDRVDELLKKYPCEYPNAATHLQVVKIFKDRTKYLELLEKLELFIIRSAGYNFIIKNIPEFAQLRETEETTRVGREEIWETLDQFGNLLSLEFMRGIAYAKFDDPEPCHSLINNMQMGHNIIHTKIC